MITATPTGAAMSTESSTPVTGEPSDSRSVEQRARRRLRAEKGFYVHLVVYVSVIGGLFAINVINGSGRWWFIWPALGWGIGLGAHALATFGLGGLLGRGWEDRRLKELIDEEQRRR